MHRRCHGCLPLGRAASEAAIRGASVGAPVAWLVASKQRYDLGLERGRRSRAQLLLVWTFAAGLFGTKPSSMAGAHIPFPASICIARRHCSRSRERSARTCCGSGCTATCSLTIRYKWDIHKSQQPRRRDVTSGFGRRRVPTRVHPSGVHIGRPSRGAAQPTSWRRP